MRFVHKSIEQPFLEALKKEIEASQISLANQNFAQVINERNLDRLVALIKPENIFLGGKYDRANRFLEPTVLRNISPDDAVMQEEIFGPILPVLAYDDIDSVIAFIKSKTQTPGLLFIY